jgi:hypothetical protein
MNSRSPDYSSLLAAVAAAHGLLVAQVSACSSPGLVRINCGRVSFLQREIEREVCPKNRESTIENREKVEWEYRMLAQDKERTNERDWEGER